MTKLAGMALLAAAGLGAASAAPDGVIVVGNFRVQALSPTVVRVEPKGPMGFEDRTSFTVVTAPSAWAGIPISIKSQGPEGTLLTTAAYDVLLNNSTRPPAPQPTCAAPLAGYDVSAPVRSDKFDGGAKVADEAACCAACTSDASCTSFVFAPGGGGDAAGGKTDVPGANCWPLQSNGGLVPASGRAVGCGPNSKCDGPSTVVLPDVIVTSPSGQVLYNSTADAAAGQAKCSGTDPNQCAAPCFWDKDASQCTNLGTEPNLLHWPSPGAKKAYALVDFPRFFTPEWGTAPIPKDAKVDPALVPTNGYDFRNNVNGDTYIFLLGHDINSWHSARRDFVKVAGPTPVLPDYAFGTWFTWWHSYSEDEAKGEVERWGTDNLPIDIWALDMNWRNTTDHQDWYYDHPAVPNLFSNFTAWFEYLRGKNLRTYFNDHPYPVASRGAGGLQTSAEEVAFRWQGLSEWMDRGLTFWWFDHNWGFSIPPPFVNTSVTSGRWDGLDNAAWGSHVYFNAVSQFDSTVRAPAGDTFYQRPMTLTKFGLPDWRPGMPSTDNAESPAQHRFPVWWTGDGVSLQASVESMVDSGVHDFKPYVHSDCGGDYRPKNGGDLLRWTAHCAYGTIHRFHGSDHRPWSYDNHTEDVIRDYLNVRYKQAPGLIAAGHQAAESGFPLVVRGDVLWPEHASDGAYDNTQYIFLNDTLVAPVFTSTVNETSRTVWVPPGDWEDAWDGSVVTGPKTVTATQPFERQPMWHNKNGGLIVTTDRPALRIDDADWSTLTLEAFPPRAGAAASTRRLVVPRNATFADRTELVFATDAAGAVTLDIAAPQPERAAAAAEQQQQQQQQAWVVRLHLFPGQHVTAVAVDGVELAEVDASSAAAEDGLAFWHISPVAAGAGYFPLGGAGTAPAAQAGPVAEFRIPAASAAVARSVVAQIA